MASPNARLLASAAGGFLFLCAGAVLLALRVSSDFRISVEGDGFQPVDDPRPAQVVVFVTDDAGLPVANAAVEAFAEPPFWGDAVSEFGFDPESEPAAALATTTGADGVAAFEGLASGDWVISVRTRGRATAFRRVEGGHAARHRLRIQLGTAHAIRGQVRDGDPVAGATVLACASGVRRFHASHWLASVRTRTGPGGEFELDALPSGMVSLWVVAPGDSPYEAGRVLLPHDAPIDLPIRTSRVESVVRPQPAGVAPQTAASADPAERRSLSGKVVDEDGSGIDAARVQAIHAGPYESEEVLAWTSTAQDGSFRLDGLPDTRIAIRIAAASHLQMTTAWDDASEFEENAVYALRPAHRIEGRIRTADGSVPRDARIWIYRLGQDRETASNGLSVLWAGTPEWWNVAEQTPAGPGATFSATWGFSPGRLVVYVTAEDFAPTVSAPFDVGAGSAAATHVDVLLDRGATLRCRLVAPDGGPVAGRPVRIRPPQWRAIWGATAAVTDDDGRFAVAHLPARSLTLSVGSLRTREYADATVTPGPEEIEVRLARRTHPDEGE